MLSINLALQNLARVHNIKHSIALHEPSLLKQCLSRAYSSVQDQTEEHYMQKAMAVMVVPCQHSENRLKPDRMHMPDG